MLGNFTCLCCRLLTFSKSYFHIKLFHKHCQSVICFGRKQFANVFFFSVDDKSRRYQEQKGQWALDRSPESL